MKSLKKIYLIALLAFASSNVFSQDYTASLSINNDNIVNAVPGGSGTFDLILTNTDPGITTIGFELTLPAGATLGKPSTYTKYDNVQTASRSYITEEDLYVISIESIFDEDENKEIPLSVNSEGAKIVTFTIDYAADFAGGEGKLANIAIGGKQAHKDKSLVIPVTFKVGAAETEKITLTKEYNTYIPAKALDFSSVKGIKAYYVTAVTATVATITETTTVAAGEGIILKGTAEAEYEVPVASGEVAKNDDNLLKTEGIAVNDYILYDGKFVLCSDGELADGKAYLPASAFTAGAKIINIVFGGESTGINEVQKSEADGAIYNLSGMRVSKTQKGVYIMNGRKVIVK